VRTRLVPIGLALAALAAAPVGVRGQGQAVRGEVKGPEAGLLRKVAFGQNLNAQLPLETPLRDEAGRDVKLGDYFGKKPVVLMFGYYECPMLCRVELQELVRNLRALTMSVGKEFDIVFVSIDPTETPAQARAQKNGYLKRYGRPGAEDGWHFLIGTEAAIERLTGVVGFKYVYDPRSKQYAHPAGLVVTTPGGRLARYVYGVNFPANTLRWALVEASEGKVGTPVDKMLLMCFHYDPSTGRYNFAVMSAVRIFGVLTLAALAGFMLVSVRRDRRKAITAEGAGDEGLTADG
jgi:protein SCO1/2